ncbi:MAG: DUF1207 domain-containing protein [bacterium]
MGRLSVLMTVLVLIVVPVQAQWLPPGHTVSPPAGGPRMLANHTKFFSITTGDNSQETLRGAEVAGAAMQPIYRWNPGGRIIQSGIEGGIYSHFQTLANDVVLISTDFSVGIPIEIRAEASGYRLKLLHISSHLGDEFQMQTGRTRISYSHESLRGIYFHDLFRAGGRLYAGGEYAINMTPETGDWIGIAGYELQGTTYFSTGDIRLRERNNWDPSIMIQVGYRIKDGAIKTGLEFFDGPLATGQFFREKRSYVGIFFTFPA